MKYIIKLKVTGRGKFPFDMLRYARAWPVDNEAVAGLMENRSRRTVVVAFHSNFRWCDNIEERFKSFGWEPTILEVS